MNQLQRWRGLNALVGDAVENATLAVERIHMATARRPFQIIECIPKVAAPAALVHEVHDAIVTNTYKQVRFWTATVRNAVDMALALAEPK